MNGDDDRLPPDPFRTGHQLIDDLDDGLLLVEALIELDLEPAIDGVGALDENEMRWALLACVLREKLRETGAWDS